MGSSAGWKWTAKVLIWKGNPELSFPHELQEKQGMCIGGLQKANLILFLKVSTCFYLCYLFFFWMYLLEHLCFILAPRRTFLYYEKHTYIRAPKINYVFFSLSRFLSGSAGIIPYCSVPCVGLMCQMGVKCWLKLQTYL